MAGEKMQLGESIELIGFNSLDKVKMFILRKIIGSHARRISGINKFERLLLLMEERPDGERFRVNAEVFGNNPKKSERIDKNIFIAVDNALKGL